MLSDAPSPGSAPTSTTSRTLRADERFDDDRLEEWPGYFTEGRDVCDRPRENIELGYEIAIVFVPHIAR